MVGSERRRIRDTGSCIPCSIEKEPCAACPTSQEEPEIIAHTEYNTLLFACTGKRKRVQKQIPLKLPLLVSEERQNGEAKNLGQPGTAAESCGYH